MNIGIGYYSWGKGIIYLIFYIITGTIHRVYQINILIVRSVTQQILIILFKKNIYPTGEIYPDGVLNGLLMIFNTMLRI